MEKVVRLRIDKYLWAIRIFKTRSNATEACNSRKVKWNGKPIKASKQVIIGEQYEIKFSDYKLKLEVIGILHQRKAFSEAVKYYLDLTLDEDKHTKRQHANSFYTGKRHSKIGRPTKRERRDLDDFIQ